jgi:uncharacterized membrane protein YgdD (TMEM256/DUF423 family)
LYFRKFELPLSQDEITKTDWEPMNKLDKNIILTAAILGAFTIAIGAFGAHGLRALISDDSLHSFETGVRYQMYHVLALLFVGSWAAFSSKGSNQAASTLVTTKKWVFRFFGFGILFFSGSLYVLSLQEVLSFSVKFLGPVTPVGGLLFVMGWLRLGYGLFREKTQYSK